MWGSRRAGMNIDSEVKHFKDMSALDQARFLTRFMYELTLEARNFYSPTGAQDIDAPMRM
jgi:hypothetical protein